MTECDLYFSSSKEDHKNAIIFGENTYKPMIIYYMRLKFFFTTLFIFFTFFIQAQSSYQVGTSQVSIEPDRSLVSLALGGYAAPREGRFTLQWKEVDQGSKVTAMSGHADKLYIVGNNNLLWKDAVDKNSSWEKAGNAENIKSIAGLNNKLYAVTGNGELLETKVEGGIKWKKRGSADRSVTTLAALGNTLFAANENGLIWYADMSKRSVEWSKEESLNGIISLAANNGRLYALTNDDILYQCEPVREGFKWLKIAYKNGITIKEDIRHIAIADNVIYGLSIENILYEGEHRSRGNLTSRAMAVKKGGETVVLVNIDLVGVNDTFTGLVKQEIFNKHHIPASAVLLNMSHTHFAPVTQDWLTWEEQNQRPDSIYLYSIVRNGILASVDNALESLAPAEIYFGRGTTDIGFQRSLPDHPELYDNSVDVIKVDYTDREQDNYLFLAACHPVHSTAGTLHYTISANFPGVARKLVEERTGTSNSLYLQGAAGDINPRDNGEYISGEKLANEVIAVLNRPMNEINGPISFYLDTINIPIEPWTKDEIIAFKTESIDKPGNLSAERNVRWSDLMLKHYEAGTMPTSLPVYVQTLNIGNWKLVGFSRETTTEYSLGIKDLWPDKLISVAGFTNDVSSYLPTMLHIEKRGYEGLDSFFWYGTYPFPDKVYPIIISTIKSLQR